MRPSHRLDLVLVPTALDAPIAGAHRLMERLREAGVIGVRSAPGPGSARWATSFTSVHIEDPGRVVLWGNRQGGFRVSCPATGAPLGPAFGSALTAWRAGPPEVLPSAATFACPGCGGVHALSEVSAAPPIGFGPWGIVTAGIGEPELTEAARAWVAETVGDAATILRRGG